MPLLAAAAELEADEVLLRRARPEPQVWHVWSVASAQLPAVKMHGTNKSDTSFPVQCQVASKWFSLGERPESNASPSFSPSLNAHRRFSCAFASASTMLASRENHRFCLGRLELKLAASRLEFLEAGAASVNWQNHSPPQQCRPRPPRPPGSCACQSTKAASHRGCSRMAPQLATSCFSSSSAWSMKQRPSLE